MSTDINLVTAPAPRESFGKYRICLVCMGNICRSPMAEVILRTELTRAGLGDRVQVESAGTGDWHEGQGMDRRARAELHRHGFDGSGHRARQIKAGWLGSYDLILAMDAANLRELRAMAQDAGGPGDDRLMLLRSFDPGSDPGAEVPDPYYGDGEDHARAFDLIEPAVHGLVGQLGTLLGGVRTAGRA